MRLNAFAVAAVAALAMPGIADADVVYDHESVSTVVETITDIGGGEYLYEYTMTSGEPLPIWNLFLYTSFTTASATSLGIAEWNVNANFVWGGLPQYDARNIDPTITWVTYTYQSDWPLGPDALAPGATAGGFSFVASVFDPSPKLYAYETQPRWVGNGNPMAAIGYTVPAPGTLGLLAAGGLAAARRRR